MKAIQWYSIAALALAPLPGSMFAQFPANGTATPADCQRAVDSLSAGVRDGGAWAIISLCGSLGANTIAAAISAAGSEQDTAYLNDLSTVAMDVRDPGVLSASLNTAANRAAAVPARLFALMVALSQHNWFYDVAGDGGWAAFLTEPRCLSFVGPTREGYTTALPAGYAQTIAARADSIADDPADNAVVRKFARCVRYAMRSAVPESVPAATIGISYICESTFRISNASSKRAQLSITVEGWSDPIGVSVGPASSRDFSAPVAGTLRLSQNGVLLATSANPNTPCP